MRIFIHNVDTYVGKALVKELRKVGPDGGFHRIFGTAASAEDAPSVVKRVVSREDPKKAKKMTETIQSCKLIVMDLFSATVEDLHFAISALKVDPKSSPPTSTGELEADCVFVLISSAMVWAQTPSEGPGAVLRDSDFAKRQPAPGSKYELWRELEELVMGCFNREGSQVKGFIVAASAMYGDGELTFGPMFQNAWCGVQEHKILAPGTNRVPLVHVRDMARLVRQVGNSDALNPMETPYFLAVDQPSTAGADRAPPSTQKEIVDAIIDELTEKYEPKVVQPSDELDELEKRMALDLNLEPSSIMLNEDFGSTCEPPGWVCREGFVANVRKIADEFCKERRLRAMRVLVAGPPASGKSTLAKAVAEHFKIPHLTLTKDNVDTMAAQLASKVCRYRGYVLDAAGMGFVEAERLFRFDVEVPPDEGEEEEAPAEGEEGEEGAAKKPRMQRRLNEDICPGFVVVTQAPDALCRARWKNRGEGSMAEFQQLVEQYSSANLMPDIHSMADFFQEVASIGVFNLPVAGRDPEDLFESVRIYMESSGRPFNYLPSEEEVAAEIMGRREKMHEEAKTQAAAADHMKKSATEVGEKPARMAERLELIQQHEEQQRQLQELPLREYLMRYMVPTLTEGLIETCKMLPDNPVDYLANYLEEHASGSGAQASGQSAQYL